MVDMIIFGEKIEIQKAHYGFDVVWNKYYKYILKIRELLVFGRELDSVNYVIYQDFGNIRTNVSKSF